MSAPPPVKPSPPQGAPRVPSGAAVAGARPSSFYDALWRGCGALDEKSPAAFHRRRLLLRLAGEREPRTILDVGCGPGLLLAELGERFPEAGLSGADLAAEALRASRRRCPEAALFELDLADGDFAKTHAQRLGRFELVVCSEVLEHLDDDAAAVQRLASLLACDGRLLVSVPGGRPTRFDLAIGHRRHYRRRELERLLAQAGLRVDRVLGWGFPFHNLYRTAVRWASRLAIAPQRQPGPSDPSKLVGPLLGRAYALVGAALRPLYYLNAPWGGEQMVALATKSGVRQPLGDHRLAPR